MSFDLPLVLGGHDFTDESAHTDSDGPSLPKGTPALVALDIAHIYRRGGAEGRGVALPCRGVAMSCADLSPVNHQQLQLSVE